MPSNPQPARRKWLKPTLIWTLIIVPLVLLLLAGGFWYSESLKLDAKLAALRAAGQPTTLAELNDFYTVPDGVADTTNLWVQAIDGVVAADISERGKSLPYVGIDGKTPVPPPGEEWPDLEASRSLINEMQTEMKAIWIAADAGGQARYPVDFSGGITTRVPYAQNARHVARLLSLDAQIAAHDGDDSRALRDIKAMYAMSDSLRGEPYLISQLVRIAIHAIGQSQIELLLPHCDWSDAELRSLQESIMTAQFKREVQLAISGQRAVYLSAIEENFSGPLCNSNKLELLRQFENCDNSFKGTWADALEQQQVSSAETKSRSKGKVYRFCLIGALLLAPQFEHTTSAGARVVARQHCTVIAIAAQRHRLKHGQLPTSLSEIDPVLLGAPASRLFSDPFTDKELLFQSDDSGIVVYSVGNNEQDDGGNVDLDDVPRDKQDIGFRLPR